MWELVSGVMFMLVLFAILMGGMIIVTRGDAELDPEDVMQRVTPEVPRVATVVGKAAPLDRGATAAPLAGVGAPVHAVAPGARVGAQR